MAAVLAPPVSVSSDTIFFRDGDTRIRYASADFGYGDVTTVPGGPTTVSFFSVSPDDKRIAVLVEDFSRSDVIGLRLFVEDLRGHGHHADIYSTTTPNGKGGVTLWPMGWHQGRLLLAAWPACTFEPVQGPMEWHVVDAATAQRLATIGSATCIAVSWPSPSGTACTDPSVGQARIYDWSGSLKQTTATGTFGAVFALSPSGQGVLQFNGGGVGNQAPLIHMATLNGSATVGASGHTPCMWIDEGAVLATDAVIQYPSGAVIQLGLGLGAGAQCAGRYPGGL